jgi:hypothetical protein
MNVRVDDRHIASKRLCRRRGFPTAGRQRPGDDLALGNRQTLRLTCRHCLSSRPKARLLILDRVMLERSSPTGLASTSLLTDHVTHSPVSPRAPGESQDYDHQGRCSHAGDSCDVRSRSCKCYFLVLRDTGGSGNSDRPSAFAVGQC